MKIKLRTDGIRKDGTTSIHSCFTSGGSSLPGCVPPKLKGVFMAKNRIINTRIWNDTYFSQCDPSEKLIFMYMLTNDKTNISGIYEIPLKAISSETGIEKDTVLRILERFEKSDKICYRNGWVAIKNFVRYQIINPKTLTGIMECLKECPADLRDWIGLEEITSENVMALKKRIIISKPEQKQTKETENTSPEVQTGSKDSLYIDYDSLSHSNSNSNSNLNVPPVGGAEKTAHQIIKTIFYDGSVILNNGTAYYHNNIQAASVKRLESRYNNNPAEFENLARKFFKIIKTEKRNYWRSAPFDPVTFESRWNAIISYKFDNSKGYQNPDIIKQLEKVS